MRLKNHIIFVLDESGSMASFKTKVIGIYNDLLGTLKTESEKNNQQTVVSLIKFSYDTKIVYEGIDIDKVKPLTSTNYFPSGGTALFDGVYTAIDRQKKTEDFKDNDVSYVIIALTDGEENQSRLSNAHSLQREIDKVQKTDRWTITFQVPPRGKEHLVALGVSSDNIREWELTEQGMESVKTSTTAGIKSYFNSRSRGLKSVSNFYVETDLTHLASQTVKSTLDNAKDEFDIIDIKSNNSLKTFVENKGYTYFKGIAYYQLMKKEIVQSYKNILIYNKLTKVLYKGDEARTLIGLPIGGHAKVNPLDHGKYEIFIQSTSVNRKLLAGTKVAIKKN